MKLRLLDINKNSVSLNDKKDITRSYPNSTRGRIQLETAFPADIVAEVYKVWGDTPTVDEPKTPDYPPITPTPSAAEQQLAAMALTQAEQASTIETLQQSNAALMLRLAELGGNA